MSRPGEPDRERAAAATNWYRLNRRQQRRTPPDERVRRPRPRPWVEVLAVVLSLALLATLAFLVVVVV